MTTEAATALEAAEKEHAEAADALEAARERLEAHDATAEEVEKELTEIQARVREIQTSEGATEEIRPLRQKKIQLRAEYREMEEERAGLAADVQAREEAEMLARRDVEEARMDVLGKELFEIGERIRRHYQEIAEDVRELHETSDAYDRARRAIEGGAGFSTETKPAEAIYTAGFLPWWTKWLDPVNDELLTLHQRHPLLDSPESPEFNFANRK